MADREAMIDTLAKAVTGPASVAGPLMATFDLARAEFGQLSDEQLAQRCDALKKLDEEEGFYAVVFDGEEQYFLHT